MRNIPLSERWLNSATASIRMILFTPIIHFAVFFFWGGINPALALFGETLRAAASPGIISYEMNYLFSNLHVKHENIDIEEIGTLDGRQRLLGEEGKESSIIEKVDSQFLRYYGNILHID